MSEPRMNREGLTFEEFWHAAAPAGEQHFGFIRTRTKLRPQDIYEHGLKARRLVKLIDGREVFDGPPAPKYFTSSATRSPESVLERAWNKGEDPSEWRKWALEQAGRTT